MDQDDFDAWRTKSTKDLSKKCQDNYKLLDGAIKKASDTGEAMRGNATTFDIELYNRSVKKFQPVSYTHLTLPTKRIV